MRNLQRSAALISMWAVLWFLYSTSDIEWAWAVFCVGAIALVLEHLAYQTGIADGIAMYRGLSDEQRKGIDNIMDSTDE